MSAIPGWFTEEDLKSNQRGVITPRQKAMLEAMAGGMVKSSRKTFPIALVFFALGACVLFAVFLPGSRSSALWMQMAFGLLFTFLAITGLLTAGFFFSRRQAQQLLDAQLRTEQGAVSFSQVYSPNSAITGYFLVVGKTRSSLATSLSAILWRGGNTASIISRAGRMK